MTETELFRELLDKQGVEWKTPDPSICNENLNTVIGGTFVTQTPIIFTTSIGRVVIASGYLIESMKLKPTLIDGSYEWWALALSPQEAYETMFELADRERIAYDDGFEYGMQAVYHQLEAIEDMDELKDFVAEYWGEGEGNDRP